MATAATTTVIWVLIVLGLSSSGQKLTPPNMVNSSGICHSVACNRISDMLVRLKDCEVILGNLRLVLMEKTTKKDFMNVTFPKLREVTGFVVIYRLIGLHSLSHIFPNLARIRGRELIYNFALVVVDMPALEVVGLYSLIKIDRGGVIVWGGYDTCYVHTVDWEAIAPHSHLVLTSPDGKLNGCYKKTCMNCSKERNFCWDKKTCQRFIEGPQAEKCHDQCLGCTKTDPNSCSVCRHYTYLGSCVSRCPDDTIILRDNKYCLTKDECRTLNGWAWNNTCVFDCPAGFERQEQNGTASCKVCPDCKKTCPTKTISTLSAIQQTDKCTSINGSLIINARSIPQALEELRKYLTRIEEVSDYVLIYSSANIPSLDFLSSLKRIGGKNLKYGKYSLVIKNMKNLRQLFTPSVTKNLKIDHGKLLVHGNPLLCMHEIEKLDARFPLKPDESDIPIGLNGYSGSCSEASEILNINVRNESSALIFFSPLPKNNIQYTVLYVKLPLGTQNVSVPETCSDLQWQEADVEASAEKGMIELKYLHPASTYAVCLETLDSEYSRLARSSIKKFDTPFDRPEPPFIWESNATSHHEVMLRWVDHEHYYKLITRYELDVILIEIPVEHQTASNHCEFPDEDFELYEDSRHRSFIRPPEEYLRKCDSACELFSDVSRDRIFEDYFDVCSSADHRSNANVTAPPASPGNSSFGTYVRTLALDINAPQNVFIVKGLAPFRDYKFRLRACAKDKCSISARSTVRTLRISNGDIPILTHFEANNIGRITLKWKHPAATNGPLLAYSIQIQTPVITKNSEKQHTKNSTQKMAIADAFCVSPHDLSTSVDLRVVPLYLVRICATTLGSYSSCGVWQEIKTEELSYDFLWGGILVSVLVFSVPFVLGFIWRRRRVDNDDIPLVDMSIQEKNESEPPTQSVFDFAPSSSNNMAFDSDDDENDLDAIRPWRPCDA